MEDVFFYNCAAIVNLNINKVCIDAIGSSTKSFKKHGGKWHGVYQKGVSRGQ